MSALRATWISAWSALPDVVHHAFSTKQRTPLKAVVTGMFPTAFQHLDPKLRTYSWLKRNPALTDEDEHLIRAAVSQAEPMLVVAALNYQMFETCRGQDDLGMSNPLETLSRLSWSVAVTDGAVDASAAGDILERHYPPAATLKNVRRALEDDQFKAELEAALEGVQPFDWPLTASHTDHLQALVEPIMTSGTLAKAEKSTDPLPLSTSETDAWDALTGDSRLPAIHLAASGLGLAHQLPVPKPGLSEPAPRPIERKYRAHVPDSMPDPRPLEMSLLERLQRPLDTDRQQLEGLTPRQVLLDEVSRVVCPLGLESPGAWAVFVIVRQLTLEIGRARKPAVPAQGIAAAALPDTRLGRSFNAAVRRVESAKASTRGYARVSYEAMSTLDDPTARYTEEVWGRAHGHDVRKSLDFADFDAVFRNLILGVRETLFRRLDETGPIVVSQADLPERAADDLDSLTLDDAVLPVVEAIEQIASERLATTDELQAFVYSEDIERCRASWDRWNQLCVRTDWLTYDVVSAVLPLLRQERATAVPHQS
jgi:hypothetical protein